MALDYKNRYGKRVATNPEYPFGKAINASSDTADDGTPFEQDYINDQWGFLQKLLVDTGQTPNGLVETASNSQYVDALKIMFRRPLEDKVFITNNGRFLAKVSYYPIGGSGSIYEVFNASTDQKVTIYANKEGSVSIPQNGENNVASPEGDINFFLEEGDYYLVVNTDKIVFSIVTNLASLPSRVDELGGSVDEVAGDLNQALDDIIKIRDEVDGSLKPNLQLETLKRESSDKELFNTTAALSQFRRESNKDLNKLTDATFEVDPENGLINLRAFNYADEQFTQAGILIDGVDARVNINAGKIVDLGDSVTNANASIDVLAGQVAIKASYTEMTEYVSGALDAILPAYSFGFFNSSEGWSAVNGTITQGNSRISVTWGDIENQTLIYAAEENPIITITCERTAGSGHTGDLIVTFSGGGTETYSGVIDDVVMGVVNTKTLNLAEESTYTGTVTGLRLVLGASVDDIYDISSITIGKPSAQLDALDGITAQVNQLGIDVDAIEGQLTSFVTTTFYEQNSVTLNNVTQVLDGEDAIISLKATQQELDSSGTVTKANSAATWIDGANATIRNTVVSFNAETGGIDDQIAGLTGGLNTVQQEVSALDGASIRNQLISVNRLETKSKDLAELQFYTELKLLDQRNKDLEIGDSVATVDVQLKAVSDEQGALSQEILELTASTGVLGGQINANSTRIQNAETGINGVARAIAALTTDVENTQGDLSSAELLLDSTVDGLGVVSSRAYLGVSNTVGGKTTITGITADSSNNGLRFQGDKIQFDDTAGNPALFYNASRNKWTLNGELVIGGYSVNSESDIRALDGDTIYEVYQYSINGSSGWHGTYTTGDIFRRTATVTNGVQGAWSAAARITGVTPAIRNNPDGSYTISNGTEEATIFDGENAPIPTAVDNGDGTYTITDGAGNSVTVSNGENGETPVKGIDYFDGKDGSFVSNIYKTSSTGAPSAPAGGSFNGSAEVIPSGYQDAPYFEVGRVTYISSTRYRQQNNGSWSNDGWSTPSEYIIKGDKGATGQTGPQGVAGKDGEDGQTTYTWIRYADTSTGGGINNNPTGKKYIGFAYNKTSPTELNDPNLYTWSLIKGTDGVKGETGKDGTTHYTWVAYSDFADGANLYQTPNANTKYIGIGVNKLTSKETSIKTDYTWSKFKGETGATGANGAQGAAGQDGQVGAGFYGATYAAISWTTETADNRFSALVGRDPVKGDIFTQTRTDGADSQARQYNGSSWGTVALQVNGSIVASGTIAGDRINSATTIKAGSGNTSASLDGADSRWRLYAGSSTPSSAPFRVDKDGNLFAENGTFGGTIYAKQVSGDLTDFDFYRLSTAKSFYLETRIFGMDVDGSDNFNRMLKVDGITFNNTSGGGPITVDVNLYEDTGTGETLRNNLTIIVPANGSATTGPLLSIVSPFSTSFIIKAVASSTCYVARQNLSATLIKKGNSIVVNP